MAEMKRHLMTLGARHQALDRGPNVHDLREGRSRLLSDPAKLSLNGEIGVERDR
jgi:hypothetical protein